MSKQSADWYGGNVSNEYRKAPDYQNYGLLVFDLKGELLKVTDSWKIFSSTLGLPDSFKFGTIKALKSGGKALISDQVWQVILTHGHWKQSVFLDGQTYNKSILVAANLGFSHEGEPNSVSLIFEIHHLVSELSRMEKMLNQGVEMIAVLDPEGHYLYNSPSYTNMMGYQIDELKGFLAFDLVYPDDLARIKEEFQRIFSENKVTLSPYRIRRKDGTYLWLQSIGTNMLDDPDIHGIIVTSSEVSDLIKIEESLKESESRYKYLFKNNPACIYVWDLETDEVLDCNQRALKLYGYTREEFIGMSVMDLRPPEDIPRIQKLKKGLKGYSNYGDNSFHGTSRHFTKDRRLIDVEINGQMIYFKGRRSSFITVHDITEKVQAEKKLLESEEKYRTVFDLSPIPKWVFKKGTFEIVEVNDQACDQYGYSRGEFLKLKIDHLFDTKEFERFSQKIKNVEENQLLRERPLKHFTKQGKLLYVEFTCKEAEFLGQETMIGLAIDQTNQFIGDRLEELEIKLLEESMAGSHPLQQILTNFLKGLEYIGGDRRMAVIKARNEKLRLFAAPSFAQRDFSFLDEPSSLVQLGPFGKAVLSGEGQVSAINKHQISANFKAFLNEFGIRTCWVQPIFDSNKKVMALFTVLFKQIVTADDRDLEYLQRFTSLLGVVMEKDANSQALILSNERYNFVNLATNDIFYDWYVQDDRLFWGGSFEKVLGYKLSDEIYSIEDWESKVVEEDRNKVLEQVWQSVIDESKDRISFSYRMIRADGQVIYVNERGFISRDEWGKAIRLVGAISDVTKQRMEEQRLLLMESVVTNTSDAVLITEANPSLYPGPKVIFVNEAFTQMTGYQPHEIIGKTPRILQGKKTNQSELDKLRLAITNWESCNTTTINYKKNGDEFWVNFSISPVSDENGLYTHWISIQRDVTKQKIEETTKEIIADSVRFFGNEERFKGSLYNTIDYLVKFGGFDLGEIWLINEDRTRINLMAKAYNSPLGKRYYERETDWHSYEIGEGIPGAVWQKEESIYLPDLSGVQGKRRENALKSGIRAVFSTPLKVNGELIGVVSFASDDPAKISKITLTILESISEDLGAQIRRKKIEEELLQLFDSTQTIICVLGFDGKLKNINEGMVRVTGFSKEELIKNSLVEFFPENEKNKFQAIWDEIIKEKATKQFQSRLSTKNGEEVWLEWSSTVYLEEELVYLMAKDISEEQELQSLLESANKMARIGFWDWDAIKDAQYWSPITKEIHEVEQDYEPRVENAINFYKKEAIPVIAHHFNRCMTEGVPYDLELPIITAKGNEIWIRTQGQPEFRNQKLIRVYGTIQDITPLKKAKLELQSALEEKNRVLESIGDAFLSVDKDWNITYWNKQAENIFKHERKKILGTNVWDSFPELKPTRIYQNFLHLMGTSKPVQMEEYFFKEQRWYELNVYPSSTGISIYLKDITLRKLTEDLIRQSNERFEKVTQATQDAIWDWDISKDTLYWGEGFKKLFGIDHQQENLNFENWESAIHPEDQERVKTIINQHLQNPNQEKIQNEYRFARADGSYADVIDRAIIIRNSKGEANRIIGAISDISDRKVFENSLKSLNEKLEARAHELSLSNAELEQFAYVASHDLQEPLRMISSFLSLLERKYKDNLDEKALEYIHFAVDGAKKMRQVILDLLEFSKVGSHLEQKETFQLAEVVDEAIKMQRKLVQSKTASIRIGKLPKLKNYRTPILQVFTNLINNALKYGRPNVPVEIEIECVSRGEVYEFSVRDNGIGIPKDSFDKIFVIFQRLQLKNIHAGTGIGLSVVKKIIENFGGKIWLESTVGEGTAFYFTLPKKSP
ncbi:MAG: PAS domain S-box protein [Bacteroidota bacterium]